MSLNSRSILHIKPTGASEMSDETHTSSMSSRIEVAAPLHIEVSKSDKFT